MPFKMDCHGEKKTGVEDYCIYSVPLFTFKLCCTCMMSISTLRVRGDAEDRGLNSPTKVGLVLGLQRPGKLCHSRHLKYSVPYSVFYLILIKQLD